MAGRNPFRSFQSTGNFLIGGAILVFFFIALFWLARGVFNILSWLAPIMIVAALVINYKVVTGYISWLFDMLKKDLLRGLIYSVLSVIGFPIVSAFLLFKALAVKKLDSIEQEMTVQFPRTEEAEFEIVEEEETVLELPPLEKENRYEELFKED